MNETARNRRWLLVSYPEGMPDETTWRLEQAPVPEPGPLELLVRGIYLSVDPYMRGRISPAPSYAQPVRPGEVMTGGGVGEVLRSNHPDFRPGELIDSFHLGWQEYAVIRGEQARRLDPALGPLHSALGHLGLPGLTAYFGLLEVGRPRPGDTVVVSAAAGAVGQIAGQLAKICGCRAVAIAGSEAKLAWCRELGFDATINHRDTGDLEAALAEACPNGVDVFFDNTAGPIHDAVMANLAQGARVIVCGTIALADRFGQPDIGLRHLRRILVTRARIEGFLVFDFAARFEQARARLAAWAKEGRLRHREDVLEGIEQMPRALLRLLRGENFGKQLVRVGALPEGIEA